jgi:hypothetical protein
VVCCIVRLRNSNTVFAFKSCDAKSATNVCMQRTDFSLFDLC